MQFYRISADDVQLVINYIDAVPTGTIPGGNLLRVVSMLQQLTPIKGKQSKPKVEPKK